jgi:hypothetical protein
VLADVTVFQGDMVRPIRAPASSAATRVEALARQHEFGNARDALPMRRASSEESLLTPKL